MTEAEWAAHDERVAEVQAGMREIERVRDLALLPLVEDRAQLLPRVVFQEPAVVTRVAELDAEIAIIKMRAAGALQPLADEAAALARAGEQDLRAKADALEARLTSQLEALDPPPAPPPVPPTSLARLQGWIERGEAWARRTLRRR